MLRFHFLFVISLIKIIQKEIQNKFRSYFFHEAYECPKTSLEECLIGCGFTKKFVLRQKNSLVVRKNRLLLAN